MTDSKMPERIWAADYDDTDGGGYWWIDPSANTGLVEYIRADLAHPDHVADAELEALDRNADALLDLDAKGVLVPHGIGGLARGIIEDQRKVITALRARTAQPVGVQWQPWDTAPTDGTKFDAWCVNANGSGALEHGVRLPDVQMRGDRSGFGFIVHLRDGVAWQYLDARDRASIFPRWVPTHWRPLPAAPALLPEGGA